MGKKNIFIVSGPIHTGKSTSLIEWAKNRSDVFGILTPKIDGKRVFMNAETKEIFGMEAEESDNAPMIIGKYKFSFAAFAKAINLIYQNSRQVSGWLIIDEIGPLEVEGKGFNELLNELMEDESFNMNLILVIRETILKDVINHYGLDRHEIKIFNPAL